MAESEGFEPPVAFRLRLISSQVHSTGLCQLSVVLLVDYFTILTSLLKQSQSHAGLPICPERRWPAFRINGSLLLLHRGEGRGG